VLCLQGFERFIKRFLAIEERVEPRRHLMVGSVDGPVFGPAARPPRQSHARPEHDSENVGGEGYLHGQIGVEHN
jgi:hypothetical protein